MKSNFLKFFITFILILLSLHYFFYFLLVRAGEININFLIDRLVTNKKVNYLSAINQDIKFIKYKIINKIEPEVIAIGSSRVLQIKDDFITKKFYNLGGTINSIKEFKDATDIILNNKNIKYIIFYLDPWLLLKNHRQLNYINELNFPDNLNFSILSTSIISFINGNWIIDQFKTNNLGIRAIQTGDGYTNDGSYEYVSIINEINKFNDYKFINTLERVNLNTDFFSLGENDYKNIDIMCKYFDDLSKIKKVYIVVPPLPNELIETNNKIFIQFKNSTKNLEDCLKLKNIKLYNYFEKKQNFNNNSCEYIDGLHSGDVLNARILVDIAKKDSIMSTLVEEDYLNNFIEKYKGHSNVITSTRNNIKETDFLKIGCSKSIDNLKPK